MHYAVLLAGLIGTANAACPYMTGDMPDSSNPLHRRDDADASAATEDFLSQFYLNDKDAFMTSDVGGPIEDQNSLSAGERGPTLLEDFIFRQKIQRFDHERVRIFAKQQFTHLLTIMVTGPRTCRPRAWSWRPRRFHILRRLVQHNCCLIPRCKGQGNTHVRPLLHRSRKSRKCRHCTRCPRIRNTILYR